MVEDKDSQYKHELGVDKRTDHEGSVDEDGVLSQSVANVDGAVEGNDNKWLVPQLND